MGIGRRNEFKSTLQATLVKEHKDVRIFDYFFPLFFESNAPPMWDMTQELSPEQQQMLQQALESLMGDEQALQDLLNQLLSGQQFTREQLEQLAQQSGIQNASHMYQQRFFSRQLERLAGMHMLRNLMEQLVDELQAMGMSDEAIQELLEMLEENIGALRQQIQNFTRL